MRTPRRLYRHGAVADVEKAVQRTEGDFTDGLAIEGERRLFVKIAGLAVPLVHLDDAPAAGKDLGEAGTLAIIQPPRSAWAATCR